MSRSLKNQAGEGLAIVAETPIDVSGTFGPERHGRLAARAKKAAAVGLTPLALVTFYVDEAVRGNTEVAVADIPPGSDEYRYTFGEYVQGPCNPGWVVELGSWNDANRDEK